jgi:hypothetical protein
MRKHESIGQEIHEELNDVPQKLDPEKLRDYPLTQRAENFINKLTHGDTAREALKSLIQSEAFRKGEQVSYGNAIHQTAVFEKLRHQAFESIKKDEPMEALRDLLNALRDGEFEFLNKEE